MTNWEVLANRWEVLANRWEEHYYVADARIRELEAKLEAVREYANQLLALDQGRYPQSVEFGQELDAILKGEE